MFKRKSKSGTGSGSFKLDYHEALAKHNKLGYEINVFVPASARHRPAVANFLNGRYYEPFSHLNFKKILDYKGGGNAVHAGAFFGDMLHTLSVNAGTVFAFEPVLDNYYFAKSNISRLGLENVVMYNAALGDENTIAAIQTHTNDGKFWGGGARMAKPNGKGGVVVEQVPVFRLDDLPIDNVALLQLDVEGFESKVLQGAVGLIAKCRPVILIEDNRGDCDSILLKLGYEYSFKKGGLNYWSTQEDKAFVDGLLD